MDRVRESLELCLCVGTCIHGMHRMFSLPFSMPKNVQSHTVNQYKTEPVNTRQGKHCSLMQISGELSNEQLSGEQMSGEHGAGDFCI